MSEREYDADLTHPLAARRIPVIPTPFPQQPYQVAVVVTRPGDPTGSYWTGIEPNEREANLLAAFLDYRLSQRPPAYRAKMLSEPFDLDPTETCYVFCKRPDNTWCYRSSMWDRGPVLVPVVGSDRATTDLLVLLEDRVVSIGGRLLTRWARYKEAHPDVFDPPTGDSR